MKNAGKLIFIPVLMLLCAGSLQAKEHWETMARGKVLGVSEGDTLEILLHGRKQTVRLCGVIDSREQNPMREDKYHRKALRVLRSLVEGKPVLVEEGAAGRKAPVETAYVFLQSDHTFVNYAVIRTGFAHARLQPEHKYCRLFVQGENEAREAGVGLWSVKPPEKLSIPAEFYDHGRLKDTVVVYLTITDKKYHRDYCGRLRHSRYPMVLKKALAAGYAPCSYCIPESQE